MHGALLQAEMTAKVSKLQKEKDFLAQTSESLLRNQDDFRRQLAIEQAAVKSKDEQIKDLTEQVQGLSRRTAANLLTSMSTTEPTCPMLHFLLHTYRL